MKSIILIVLWQNQFFMVNPAGACVIVHHFDSFEGRYRDLFGNDYFCQLNCRRLIGIFFICRRSRFSSVIRYSENAILPAVDHPNLKNSGCLLMKELLNSCLWIRQFSYYAVKKCYENAHVWNYLGRKTAGSSGCSAGRTLMPKSCMCCEITTLSGHA